MNFRISPAPGRPHRLLPLLSLAVALLAPASIRAATVEVATDQTNYNVGSPVLLRASGAGESTASIRYAGETSQLATGLPVQGDDYQTVWTIPSNARTGRYEIDLTPRGGKPLHAVASFAVHRQLAKVTAFDLDKTFYTAGDPVNPRIVVQNISDHPLQHLQVEFENYTYPWIAPAAGEPPAWKTIAAPSLSLAPGESREFRLTKAAVVQAQPGSQTYVYFSAVIRDSEVPDHIYDLAFSLPAITVPPSQAASAQPAKTYPMLYLYPSEKDVPASESYRNFYPAAYVSDAISFQRDHTMFASHAPLSFEFTVAPTTGGAHVRTEILDNTGKVLSSKPIDGAVPGAHTLALPAMPIGLYTLQVVVTNSADAPLESSRLDFAVNDMPKSILVFAAHEDDDTAHPEIIRAAIENHIPLHVVYFTGGDAGGCDRYFMHSCDASRAMDFGEVRMGEARASLGHLGVPPENIFFLGLPDGGMQQIWEHTDNSKPYLSVLLASEHSPYPNSAIPNLPYARPATVAAAEGFITRFHPDLILTGHPEELHVDHRTNNWVVVKAMQNLLRQGKLSADTQLIVDQVYGPDERIHAPYEFEKTQFYVSGDVAKLGQEASWYYQTQDGNHQQAEIVPYNKLRRDASPNHFGYYHWPYPHYRILDWQAHEGWNER